MTVFLRYCLALLLLATSVRAEVPAVVTDISPVQSLVAMVMRGLGSPQVIVAQGNPPHGTTLRPSQARALQAADLVIWMGPGLTPRLAKPINTLAAKAQQMVLLDAPGTYLLSYREADGKWPADPHAWLDPENGKVWLGLIAEMLTRTDPDNAALYRANSRVGQKALTALQGDLSTMLAPMQSRPYLTYHDAYQYFETRFGLMPIGAVTAGDAAAPGPAKLAQLRAKLAGPGEICVFAAPQSDPRLLRAVTGADDLKIIPLDPMGNHLDPGPDLYPALLRDMARAFAACANKPAIPPG